MKIMRNVYETLKQLEYFVDNEYLLKYAQLVDKHTVDKRRTHLTNSHHIIPKSWFKLMGQPVDNTAPNLVNLPYREHILAHYYLCLCTTDPFTYANQLGFMCLLTRKKLNPTDRLLVQHLSMYNNIYEDYMNKRKNNYKLYEVDVDDNERNN